jgi:hypothetical protein
MVLQHKAQQDFIATALWTVICVEKNVNSECCGTPVEKQFTNQITKKLSNRSNNITTNKAIHY